MRNLTLLTDLYQLTMMNGYFNENTHEETMIFDVFFRQNPSRGGYTVVCGIDEVIDYIENLHFEEEDTAYLRSLNTFDDAFLDYLKNFKFTGEIYAVEEGSVMFPNEPLLRVKAKAVEAQFIETAILCIINFQSLIATKSSRICQVAKDDVVMEFGLRRSQGPDAGIYGAKAAIVGGAQGTSNVLTGKLFNVPVMGTHAHSWIQKFDSEIEAFRSYAKTYPDKTILLIDTYDTLESGLPNAITVFKEMRKAGHEPLGVRIDSGDLEYLSKEIRKRLDEAGFENVKITASNDLDEYTLIDLKLQGAKIDSWGIGTKLITSSDWPSLGGVYKLVAVEKDGVIKPKIKISESPEKITNPGYKKIIRIYNKENDKAEADLIMLNHEIVDTSKPLTIFHPVYTWKRKTYKNYYIKELLQPLFIDGKCVRKKKTVLEYRDYAFSEKNSLWPQYLRLSNPEPYKVDLSEELWNIKNTLINKKRHRRDV